MQSNDVRKTKAATFTTRVFKARDAMVTVVASHKVDFLDVQLYKASRGDISKLIERHLRKNKGSRYKTNELIILSLLVSIRDVIEGEASKEDLDVLDNMILQLKSKIMESDTMVKSVYFDILGIRVFLKLLEKYGDFLDSIDIIKDGKYRSTVSVRIPKDYTQAVEVLEKYKSKVNVKKSQLLREAVQRLVNVVMSIDDDEAPMHDIVKEVIDGIVVYGSEESSQQGMESFST